MFYSIIGLTYRVCFWVRTNWQVFVHMNQLNWLFCFHLSDAPRVELTLGKSISASSIYEGGDVYFDCFVKSRPPPTRILWHLNVSYSQTGLNLPITDICTLSVILNWSKNFEIDLIARKYVLLLLVVWYCRWLFTLS